LRARKALALLAYLAAEGGARPREELVELLWPASDEARGRSALRSALLSLRAPLKEEDGSFDENHLRATGDLLCLGEAPHVSTDLRILEDGYAMARSGDRVGDRQEALSRLEAAVAAYRGEFLQGFRLDDAPDFDHWLDLQRQAGRRRASLVYDRLSGLQAEGGDLRGALRTADAWAGLDPLDEGAAQRLMEAQLALGDRAGALDSYEALRSALGDRLGAAPSPETDAVAARARARAPSARESPRAGRPDPTAFPETPFVDRVAEFAALVEGYRLAASGSPRAVVLVGDGGIGKTRLAEEFLAWASARGADVLRGRSHEVGGRIPYGVLVDALRPRIERERAPDDLLEDAWLSELSRLLPELRGRYPDLPSPVLGEEAEARQRLFEAISRLVTALAGLSASEPVVLFADDLHWSSRASLDVLKYAGRRWAEEGARVLLVLGLRPESTDSVPSPDRWLSELGRELPVRRLDLASLAAGDTLDMLRVLSGAEAGVGDPELERFGEWLFRETGGQPLFLAETIKDLSERGLLETRTGARGEPLLRLSREAREGRILGGGYLPESVRAAIRAQLSRLGGVAARLLTAGAVLGHGFTFERLIRVAELGEEEGLSALDEALAGRLVVEAHGGRVPADSYAFAHDKIRDVAYTESGAARRRVFHRRALEVLGGEGAPASDLARHALAAGEAEAAFRHFVAAGDEAMAVFAVKDAIGLYEQARRLLSERHPATR
jgi:DNA-binding SARP family transcriptional activator